jgi:hypothetical protein
MGVGYVCAWCDVVIADKESDIVVDNCAICRNHIMDLCGFSNRNNIVCGPELTWYRY